MHIMHCIIGITANRLVIIRIKGKKLFGIIILLLYYIIFISLKSIVELIILVVYFLFFIKEKNILDSLSQRQNLKN